MLQTTYHADIRGLGIFLHDIRHPGCAVDFVHIGETYQEDMIRGKQVQQCLSDQILSLQGRWYEVGTNHLCNI